MMNPVVHFEMPYHDRDRAARFYAEAFGWKLEKLGAEMGHYVTGITAETDARPGEPAGAITVGMYEYKKDWPAQYPSAVIAVEDMAAAMARVTKAGGEVLGEPMLIPGIGDYVAFFDTERNRHSMLKAIPPARK